MWWLRLLYHMIKQGECMHKFFLLMVLITVLLSISGCADVTPTAMTTTSPLTEPVSPLMEPVSPMSTPVLELAPGLTLVPFVIDRPLREGDTRITGSGVPGIPIVLEDVTFAGKFIAAGVVDDNGRFDIQLSAPLEARHRVGLILNIADTPYNEQDLMDQGFRGEGAMVIPQVGFYHDTFMVLEP